MSPIRSSPAAAPASCFNLPLGDAADLDLTNRTSSCAELDWTPFASRHTVRLAHNGIAALAAAARAGEALELLDLSHNGLQRLPAAFLSRAPRLQQLFLQHNALRELPRGFFAGAPALRTLRLDGNPLHALPALPARLQRLRLPCRCALLHACTVPSCLCDSGDSVVNGTDPGAVGAQ
ncbi:chondroadherin-like protein [Nothoprocta perdicaria]|uniref:chondroadherin-like protein n=1 Tax=Nothoprocta perdicaria TaxID=30464 RepID=UPI000E1B992E|nr:chondroadherin-like protein [Nothoprocta perdicaria]